MKWILICVLIVVIMAIAFGLSEQYKDKFDFYNNLKQMLNQLKINISFKQENLNAFLSNLKPKRCFKTFIEDYKAYLSSGTLSLANLPILEPEERAELESIVKNIGKFDKSNEITQLDSFVNLVDEKLKQAAENKNKLCPMIIKLSLLFALGLAILLV